MAKALCISGMVVAVLVALLFTADLVAKWPFNRASLMMDVSFLICAIVLGLISWMTYREQA